jgi:hypothetical protein
MSNIMRNLDSKKEVINIINNILIAENKKIYPVFQSELIETGKMTNGEIQQIIGLVTDLNDVRTEILIWLYSSILKYHNDIPPLDHFFEQEEIKQAEIFQIKRIESQFPLRLKILDKLDPYHEDYLISLSIKQINSLQENGIFKLNVEMQRESEITTYNGQLISHISYDDDRSREIGDDMASYNYRSDTIRLILIIDGEEKYNIKDNDVIIRTGNIALIDGNHRVKGLEYGLLKNEDIELKLPVIFTIGTVQDGQIIINQSEKRQPLNKEFLKTYDNAPETNIVKKLKLSDELDKVYKFCKTPQEISKNAGFVIEGILIDYIKKYYNTKNISKKQQDVIRDWLIGFFNTIADFFNIDFNNFQNTKKIKWNVSPYCFAGYIQLSSYLQNKENWENLLIEFLSKINFNLDNKPWKEGVSHPDKNIDKFFKEMIINVFGKV